MAHVHDEFEADLGPPPGVDDPSGSVEDFEADFDDGIPAKSEREMAMWLHLSQLSSAIVPLAGVVVPIVLWQTKKDEMPSIDQHGRNAVNWIISSFIYVVVSAVLVLVFVGIVTLVMMIILSIVFPIMAGVKANRGEVWEYPLAIRFLK